MYSVSPYTLPMAVIPVTPLIPAIYVTPAVTNDQSAALSWCDRPLFDSTGVTGCR